MKTRIICFLSFMMCVVSLEAQKKSLGVMTPFYISVLDEVSKLGATELTVVKVDSDKLPSKKSLVSSFEQVEILPLKAEKRNALPNTLTLDIPFEGHSFKLVLKRNFITTSEYTLKTSSPYLKSRSGAYYHGIIQGEQNGWATLSWIDGKYQLLIASKKGNIESSYDSKNRYSLYKSSDLTQKESYKCLVKDDEMRTASAESNARSVGSDCVELYIECDFQSYLDNGSSVASTEAWALSIINNVSTIYNTVNIPLVVSEVFVWNSSDPYVAETSMQAVRDSFVTNVQNNYTGRVAQLFSTRPLGSGLAYGLGGLCGVYPEFPGPYSIATSLSTSFPSFPNYSFTVNVVAHELGHVFGARHTHACVWGADGDSQIDDCGNVHAINIGDTPEGQECFDVDNPIIPVTGTIMSFCNLEGGGIDLANGFATEVGNLLVEEFETALCATGGACASIPPSNDDCSNAIIIEPRGVCNLVTYDNLNSSDSGVADPSCGPTGVHDDVWFSFEATNITMNATFNPVDGEVEDVSISFYSGSCSGLTEVFCEDIDNVQTQVKVSPLTIGDTYFIRIIQEGGNQGEFELCLEDTDAPCHPAYTGLVDLYNDAGGANWTDNTGWVAGAAGTDCDPCLWYGVTCDNLGNVIELDLFNNNLVGTVPQTMEQLDKLRTLKLMNNSLSGTFPDIWTEMTAMEFVDLSNNNFTGTMPTSLSNMQKLNTLYIENNSLTGQLLPEIGDLPLINVFWIKNNNMEGCYPGSYSNLCDAQSVKFTNNPLLPNMGNEFDDFCSGNIGGDIDGDGFCFGVDVDADCVDEDDTIYPNAPEICDGKDNDCDGDYDENLVSTITWTSNVGGDWNDPSNWNLGVVPAACMDVVFPPSGSSIMVTIDNEEEGVGRSVTIGNNVTVVNNGNMTISGSDDYGVYVSINAGFDNNETAVITNVENVGLEVEGFLINNGNLQISNLSIANELRLLNNGSIENNSTIEIK